MLSFLYKVLGITLPLVWSSRSVQNIIIAVLVAQFYSILLSTNPYISLHYELNCTISHSKSKFILLLFLIMGYYYCQLSYNVDYLISQLSLESFDVFCQPIPLALHFPFFSEIFFPPICKDAHLRLVSTPLHIIQRAFITNTLESS